MFTKQATTYCLSRMYFFGKSGLYWLKIPYTIDNLPNYTLAYALEFDLEAGYIKVKRAERERGYMVWQKDFKQFEKN
ncbi:hypothetical protein [Prevotella bivia]|nr:hypothetical protein [Prevotella bivia]